MKLKSLFRQQLHTLYTYQNSKVQTVSQNINESDVFDKISYKFMNLNNDEDYKLLINNKMNPNTIGFHSTLQVKEDINDSINCEQNMELLKTCKIIQESNEETNQQKMLILNFKNQESELENILNTFNTYQRLIESSFDIKVIFKIDNSFKGVDDILTVQQQISKNSLLINFNIFDQFVSQHEGSDDNEETQLSFLNEIYNLIDNVCIIKPNSFIPSEKVIKLLKAGQYRGYLLIDEKNVSSYDNIHTQLQKEGYNYDPQSELIVTSSNQSDSFNPADNTL